MPIRKVVPRHEDMKVVGLNLGGSKTFFSHKISVKMFLYLTFKMR